MKTILINKQEFFYSSVFAALSTTVFMLAVVRLAKSDDIISIAAVCLATFIGTLIPGLIVKKSEKEKMYIFDITADSLNSGKEFADELRTAKITTKTSVVYDNKLKKTLSIKAYCSNRAESKIVNEVIRQEFKYNVYVPLSVK